ncbi:MAG TPA: DNA-binding protein, partial [Bauldia sp.]|nr:DNA-binding protein [Bauldia sp.]
MQGRAPDSGGEFLKVRLSNHSTVAIQELMHTVGVLDPAHPGTRGVVRQIGILLRGMPAHRVFTPDADVLGRAALLSGILCRLQGYRKDAQLRALQDCLLFLQAQKLGLTVLTANVADFDCLLQLVPAGRVLFYRRSQP